MQCPSCHQQTPDDSRYCCHCGAALQGGGIASGADELRETIEDTAAQAQQSLEVKARELRTTTVADAQKDILSWVKIQFWSVTVMLGLFIGFLAFLGYQRYEDFVATIDRQKEEVGKQAHSSIVAIANTEDSVMGKIEESKQSAQENIDRLNAISEQVRNFEQRYKVKNIEQRLSRYETVFRNIDQLEAEAIEALKDIRMLGNSRYRFIVHITHTGTPGRETEIQRIMALLDEYGYVIGPESFKDITADECQLLYYNAAIKDKARDVVALLGELYPRMRVKQQPSHIQRDPYMMLIKVPSPAVDAGCRG